MKKIISIVTTIFMVISMSVNVLAVGYGEELKNAPVKTYKQQFSDVPQNYWAFEYISEMAERGVLSGYPDGKFYPESQVTRAEFAKIMTMAANLNLAQPTMQIFEDVSVNEWYATYIHTAKEYLSAYEQNGRKYYMPDSPALREDIAVALVKLKGYPTLGADLNTVTRMFSDHQSISSGAKIYVAAAIENGLISGYEDGTFRGQNGITRSEAATLLWRAYQYGNANKTYGNDTTTTNPSVNISDKVVSSETNENLYKEDEKSPAVQQPQETGKSYTLKKLASANLASSGDATIDNKNNIYYIDQNDNCVYKVSVSNGSKEKYFDTTKLTYEVSENAVIERYSSFVPVQMYYDGIGDRLMLVGYYTSLLKAGSSPLSGDYIFIYDLTNDKAYCKGEMRGSYPIDYIHTFINSDSFLYTANNNVSAHKSRLGEISTERQSFGYLKKGGSMRCGNYIYYISGSYGEIHDIYKTDFNSVELVAEDIYAASYGIKGDSYYFLEDQLYKMSVKNSMPEVIIENMTDDVENTEMTNFDDLDKKFFVVDDNTFVFYDTIAKAFLLLEQN